MFKNKIEESYNKYLKDFRKNKEKSSVDFRISIDQIVVQILPLPHTYI
jgi:hypothetical protein